MTAATANLPALSSNLSPEGNLSRYLSDIRKFPLLEPQEEFMLAKRWREHGDSQAAHKLVTSHLRLVAKIAMGYRGYGLPVAELISEGNVGMMQAVKRFDPERGFRLATYAMWWIRAAIQEYILHSWSLVKMGTTAAQKKLFFNLRKVKNQMQAMEEGTNRVHVDRSRRRAGWLSTARIRHLEFPIAPKHVSLSAQRSRLNPGFGSRVQSLGCGGPRRGRATAWCRRPNHSSPIRMYADVPSGGRRRRHAGRRRGGGRPAAPHRTGPRR